MCSSYEDPLWEAPTLSLSLLFSSVIPLKSIGCTQEPEFAHLEEFCTPKRMMLHRTHATEGETAAVSPLPGDHAVR